MVDRCKIESQDCVVVDLDGTLIDGNSLKELTKFLLSKFLSNYQISRAFDLSRILIMRKLKRISHLKMKLHIIEYATNNLTPRDLEAFSTRLINKTNPDVIKLLKEFNYKNSIILIATAAPELYLPGFIKKIPLKNISYTGSKYDKNGEWIENRSMVKSDNVSKILVENNLKCVAVISDHEDDLPLFRKFDCERYLVKPSRSTRIILEKEIPGINII